MKYKQIQIDFYKDNPKLEQSVYDFFEIKGFDRVIGSYSYFQSKEPMSLVTAKSTVSEFTNKFTFLLKDIRDCTIIETGKPQSLLHLFKDITKQ